MAVTQSTLESTLDEIVSRLVKGLYKALKAYLTWVELPFDRISLLQKRQMLWI
jgi:hypothetical protein